MIDTGGWYKLCCPTSQLSKPDVLGAIYRVRKKDAKRVEDPRGLKLAWASMTADELAKLLDDPRPAVQKRAIQAIAKLGPEALPALERARGSITGRRNVVWAASRIGHMEVLQFWPPRARNTQPHRDAGKVFPTPARVGAAPKSAKTGSSYSDGLPTSVPSLIGSSSAQADRRSRPAQSSLP